MPGPGAAVFKGVCSGHGKCVPGVIHATIQCIPSGGICAVAPKKTVMAMNAYTMWPPAPLLPLAVGLCLTVKVEKLIPIVMGDQLQLHKTPCMNTVNTSPCPKAQKSIVPISCNASVFTCADDAGGVGHVRVAVATSKTVFFEKKNACRIGDGFALPCLSKIPTGAITVYIGP